MTPARGRTLAGSTALVTGGGSGIGRATSLRLADEGATVLVVDLDGSAAESVVAEIMACGGSGYAEQVDVAADDVEVRLEALLGRWPVIDVLVNNAGVGAIGTILDTDDATWRRLFSVNVDGVFHCTRAVLPAMLDRGRGSVVNIASVAGMIGLASRFAYSASKASIIGMTRALAIDYARSGVRFNCICPGTVDTPWVQSFAAASSDPEAFRERMAARQPIGRMGSAEEIAAAVAFLVRDESAFVTGSSLIIDGGLTAGLPAS